MSFENLKIIVSTIDLSFVDKYHMERRRKIGKIGNKVSSYLKAFLLKHILQIASDRQLATKLKNNKELCRICGFRKAPHHTTVSKSRKRISLAGMEHVFSNLVSTAKKIDLIKGRIVAIDSTDFSAYCNGKRKFQDRSDTCARWGYSTTKGRVFGYKAHVICDAESELPISFTVLPASKHDSVGFFPTFRKMLVHFSYHVRKFLADCAYDALEIRKMLKSMKDLIARNGRGKFKSKKPRDKDYRKRVAIERINSRFKEDLGLERLKLRGLWGAAFHAAEVACSMLYAAIGSFLAGFRNWRSIVALRE